MNYPKKLQDQIDFIKKSVGTEFVYEFEDGSEIPAVVAAFDEKIGFTCLATELVDSYGDDHASEVDANGNLCLYAADFKHQSVSDSRIQEIYEVMEEVSRTGRYVIAEDVCGFGDPSCSF